MLFHLLKDVFHMSVLFSFLGYYFKSHEILKIFNLFINSWNNKFTSGFMHIYSCIIKVKYCWKKNVYLPLFDYTEERAGDFSFKVLLFAVVPFIFVDN